MPVYRFRGDKREGHKTGKMVTVDAEGILREVKIGDTIELTAEQVTTLREAHASLVLAEDSIATAPVKAVSVKVVGELAHGDTIVFNEAIGFFVPIALGTANAIEVLTATTELYGTTILEED